MAFLNENNLLVLDRDNGRVYLINVKDSTILEEPVLDVDVSTNGFRGLLGMQLIIEYMDLYHIRMFVFIILNHK